MENEKWGLDHNSDLLVVIGEGIIIGMVVVLEGVPEGNGVFAFSCEWFGSGPDEAWCSGLGHDR